MILLIIILSFFPLKSQIINEFQPIQSDEEPEWIEIYNEKNFEVNLENMIISDAVTSKSLPNISIPANSYIIVTPNKLLLLNKYNLSSDKVFEFNFPTLNNNIDRIMLEDEGEFVDSLSYDMVYFDYGKSIERVDSKVYHDNTNWKSSIDINGATPLKENSVKIVDFNLSIRNVEFDGTYLIVDIDNNGRNLLNELDFYLYFDWNFNKEIENDEVIYSQIDLSLDEKISLKYRFEDILDINEIFGLVTVGVRIVNSYDEKKNDDYVEKIINIPPNESSILFNEIMFDPSNESCEYIELYNPSNFDIDLVNLTLHDLSNKEKEVQSLSNKYILKSKEYLVIASDSSILSSFKDILDLEKVIITNKSLSLNNSNDELYLKWNNSKIIDSVFYNDTWHSENTLNTKGVSLEKKGLILASNEKDNWTSSSNVFGGTPTMQNTVIPQDNGKYGLLLEKNPFSFVESDLIKISYFSPYQNSIINLSIYDKNGLKLGVIKELGRGAYSGEVRWDGKINNKSLITGSYILYFECINADTQEMYIDKELFVIVN